MSTNHASIDALDALLEDAVAEDDAAGIVAIAADDAGTAYLGAAGWQDREAGRAMADDTIFYTASMTKAITSVAAMQLVEQGRLGLDRPVAEVLPALASPPVLEGYDERGEPRLRPARRPITLRHLLTHTSGLAYTVWNAELFEYRQRFPDARPIDGPDVRMSAPLVHDPGERWEYSTSTDWVGLAVEAVTGQRLGDYFREHVFAPLDMEDTGFEVPEAKRHRVAARYVRRADGGLEREPPSTAPAPAFQSGGGGLHSTASDYARFLAALLGLEGPMRGRDRVLSRESFADMARNHIGGLRAGTLVACERQRSNDVVFFPGTSPGWGLGFLINPEPGPGGRSAGSLTWGGLYNTYFWLDPHARVAGAIFTQLLPFVDPRVLARYEQFERAVYAAR